MKAYRPFSFRIINLSHTSLKCDKVLTTTLGVSHFPRVDFISLTTRWGLQKGKDEDSRCKWVPQHVSRFIKLHIDRSTISRHNFVVAMHILSSFPKISSVIILIKYSFSKSTKFHLNFIWFVFRDLSRRLFLVEALN